MDLSPTAFSPAAIFPPPPPLEDTISTPHLEHSHGCFPVERPSCHSISPEDVPPDTSGFFFFFFAGAEDHIRKW